MRPPSTRPLTHLGSLSVGEFMRRYWQKRPVLLRQALPRLSTPVSAERLFELAQSDVVEARMVTSFGGWRLRHGPFKASDLPARTRKRWTLLVQGVDRHDAAARLLLARFRFVPDARLDDLMVSFATDGGGVGAHVDSYDVFLVQAFGSRRWRIGRQRDYALVPGLPLAILADFRSTREWVLEPGDVLYLPPGVAHEGVALGDCITCSVGFRAPRWQELVAPWHAWLEESTHVRGAYRDPDQQPTNAPACLPRPLIDAAYRALARRPTRADAEAMLLRALSEPKPGVVFARPVRRLSEPAFVKQAGVRGIALDPGTRLLYSGRRVAINGELLDRRLTAPLRRLADDRTITGRAAAALAAGQSARLHDWYVYGWIRLLREMTDDRPASAR